MRDILPGEYRRRQYLTERFRGVYERYGFEPIDTPALERLDVLLGKGGEDNEKLIFKVQKRGASLERSLEERGELCDAGLRFDLTVPLARYYAEHRAELPRVFRRYHIAPVWRADRPARGRFREFYQCDVDILGTDSVAGEIEVIFATADALRAVGFTSFVVRLNDRRLLRSLLEAAGVPEALQQDAVVTLDKMDKVGVEGVAAELGQRGLPARAIELLSGLDVAGVVSASPAEGLERLRQELERLQADSGGASSAEAEAALSDLGTIVRNTSEANEGLDIVIDPLLARGMGYYTGPIFEIASEGVPFSLGGGGRFDGLIGRFGKENVKAVGFSIGFERVLTVMTERNMFPGDLGGLDAYVTVFEPTERVAAQKLARELRAAGLRTLVPVTSGGLKGQLKEANDRGARVALIVGPTEREQGVVQMKQMETGQAELVARAELTQRVVALVRGTG
jgi:histidyl-tRNA synthetase